MRNREQIYGQEAAELLRNITVYHCMRRDQLLRLYPGKEGVIENLLRYLVKQQRIFYNTDRDCYGDVPDCREDRELTAALWVLLDFIEKVEYHSPDNMPAKLVFFADGEVYEVVYVGPGMRPIHLGAFPQAFPSCWGTLTYPHRSSSFQPARSSYNCACSKTGAWI